MISIANCDRRWFFRFQFACTAALKSSNVWIIIKHIIFIWSTVNAFLILQQTNCTKYWCDYAIVHIFECQRLVKYWWKRWRISVVCLSTFLPIDEPICTYITVNIDVIPGRENVSSWNFQIITFYSWNFVKLKRTALEPLDCFAM